MQSLSRSLGSLRTHVRTHVFSGVLLAVGGVVCTSATGQELPIASPPTCDETAVPTAYRSRHFLIHTDLPPVKAEALLKQLERQLASIEEYWGQPLKGIIHCYVADCLIRWPDNAFPDRFGRLVIDRIGGASKEVVETKDGKRTSKAIVYASSRPGVARHEIVHAYCLQTFGATGPNWYKEGMAELVNLGDTDSAEVRCPVEYEAFFRSSKRQTVQDVFRGGRFTAEISRSIQLIAEQQGADAPRDDQATLRAWTAKDDEVVAVARDSYRNAWALCHFLCHNPNYKRRFRLLGKSYLLRRHDSFSQAFAPVGREMHFEFEFFLDHFAVGYDVSRCHWDWKTRFHKIGLERSVSLDIAANRGYQASAVRVGAGEKYAYLTNGHWNTNHKDRTTADGSQQGQGRLVGVVMNSFRLSPEFDLGVSGTFTTPVSGDLYLRCRDKWNELSDNRGSVRVKLSHGKPLGPASEPLR